MEHKKSSYARFYIALNHLTIKGDRRDCKRQLVRQYTGGRTDSLREMSEAEYRAMCEGVERIGTDQVGLRRKRSTALKLMQQLGIDTTRWGDINDFCSNPRIAGKPFAGLTPDELDALARKLRGIKRKGWERRSAAAKPGEIPYKLKIETMFGMNMN